MDTTADPHFVHQIDPVILVIGDVDLYYYGLAYTIGFLCTHLWFMKRRSRLGWTEDEVCDFSIILMAGVLICGRAFEIVVYEWGYYASHPSEIFSYWHGGMASHGVLLGGVAACWLFSHLRHKSFTRVLDELALPAALFLALGRIGNFINGQIYGFETDVWWGVRFPDAEGFRHPVALYESLKNFAIIPILLFVRRTSNPGEGKLIANFVFWYGFLRLFTDHFRDYGGELFGIGKGQYFNLFMAVLGLALIIWSRRSEAAIRPQQSAPTPDDSSERLRVRIKTLVIAALIAFSLVIPSSWTQGVLMEYREQQEQQDDDASTIVERSWELSAKPE